jgi:hypothetical protein
MQLLEFCFDGPLEVFACLQLFKSYTGLTLLALHLTAFALWEFFFGKFAHALNGLFYKRFPYIVKEKFAERHMLTSCAF